MGKERVTIDVQFVEKKEKVDNFYLTTLEKRAML